VYGSQASQDVGQNVNRPTEKASDTMWLASRKLRIYWETNSKTTPRDSRNVRWKDGIRNKVFQLSR
jgi:hypothetical protein